MSANPIAKPAFDDPILRELWRVKDQLSAQQLGDPDRIVRRHLAQNYASKAGKISLPFQAKKKNR